MMKTADQQRMTPQEFVDQLSSKLPSLISAVLYGSAAAGDFVPGASSHDLLLIAKEWSHTDLERMAELGRNWQSQGNPVPQLFTADELASAADVFLIEILDLQQSRQVLLGPDLIAGLKVALADLRLQLEHELRSKLLFLRQRCLAACGDAGRTAAVLRASLSTFLVLFRASLRLYDNTVPAQKQSALLALATHLSFDPQPMLTLLQYKERLTWPESEVAALAGSYLTSIEQVVAAVDRHIRSEHQTGDQA